MNAQLALQEFWTTAGGDPAALESLRFDGDGEQLPSVFQVGSLAAGSVAAQALAAAELWRLRSGKCQQISIPMRHAQALFRSERYLKVKGQAPADVWSPIAGYYQAGDGRWIQLHTNFAHHRDGVLRVLECDNSRDSVAAAIRHWQAAELDDKLAQEGMCASLIRDQREWQEHPQAIALAGLPLFELVRIGDAPPMPMPPNASRPLSGVRVLDLSRVIAAPLAGRTLAQHGADVMAIGAAHLPNIEPLVVDNGRGKRSALLDLRGSEGRAGLHRLLGSADIFMQAYRPGSLAAFGYSHEELCRLYPGLIQVDLSAYGHVGPWAKKRGFDSLVQSASGIAHAEGVANGLDGPGKLPCQALDHATGTLAAFAAMMALHRRAREGGSWLVRVSLAQTGHWLQKQGQYSVPTGKELNQKELAPCMQSMESPYGIVMAVSPAEQMSLTPPHFDKPPVPLGTHQPVW